MIIPDPKAKRGELIEVKNYRRKGLWQKGKITCLSYRNPWGSWYWGYDVVVTGANGSRYRLYIDEDAIRKIKIRSKSK